MIFFFHVPLIWQSLLYMFMEVIQGIFNSPRVSIIRNEDLSNETWCKDTTDDLHIFIASEPDKKILKVARDRNCHYSKMMLWCTGTVCSVITDLGDSPGRSGLYQLTNTMELSYRFRLCIFPVFYFCFFCPPPIFTLLHHSYHSEVRVSTGFHEDSKQSTASLRKAAYATSYCSGTCREMSTKPDIHQ